MTTETIPGRFGVAAADYTVERQETDAGAGRPTIPVVVIKATDLAGDPMRFSVVLGTVEAAELGRRLLAAAAGDLPATLTVPALDLPACANCGRTIEPTDDPEPVRLCEDCAEDPDINGI